MSTDTTSSSSQQFLRELDRKLWTAAPERKTTASKITTTDKLIDYAAERENPNGAERHGLSRRAAHRVRAGAGINHGGSIGDIMVFGEESNPTTWQLAAMNVAIRGIGFDFGKEPADTFTRDQQPDHGVEFVMAKLHFNIQECWDGKLEGNARRSERSNAAAQRDHRVGTVIIDDRNFCPGQREVLLAN